MVDEYEIWQKVDLARGGAIVYDDVVIGRHVTYGKGGTRGNVGTRTVHASRIYGFHGEKIEVEAGSARVLRDKVAKSIHRILRAEARKAKAAAKAAGDDPARTAAAATDPKP